MSDPFHLSSQYIVTNGNMSSSINSLPINLDEGTSYSVHASYTGTPVGTLQLQCSDDYDPVLGTGTWTIITDSVRGISAAGSYMINVEFPAYSWVRLQYVSISSVGIMNAKLNQKRR